MKSVQQKKRDRNHFLLKRPNPRRWAVPLRLRPRPAVFASLRGVGAVSLGHTRSEIRAEPSLLELCPYEQVSGAATLQPLSPLCAPLPALHRPSPKHNSKPGTSSRHDVVARISIGIDEHKRNRYCVSDALTHFSIITAQCQNCPALGSL